jgi:hypothetical protein
MSTTAHHQLPLLNRRRFGLAVAGAVALSLMACAALAPSSPSAKTAIRKGMRPETVTAMLGEPTRRELFAPDRYVYFYDSGPYKGKPLCFDKHRVVHIGPELLASWRKERLIRTTGGESAGELSSKAKARVKATLKAERNARIAELERQVKPLPVSATGENLRLYRELLSLAPDNARYRRKVAFYRARLEAEQTQKKQAVELAAKKRQEVARKRRNKALRVYEGNDKVQIAIHELGRGELYLWVKNLSDSALLLVSSYYRLLDADSAPITMRVGSELQGLVAAGGIAYGKLIYDAKLRPSRLILDHPKAGVVEKWFPGMDTGSGNSGS